MTERLLIASSMASLMGLAVSGGFGLGSHNDLDVGMIPTDGPAPERHTGYCRCGKRITPRWPTCFACSKQEARDAR